MVFAHCHMHCTLYRAKFSFERGVSNLEQTRRYRISSDSEPHSQVIEVVKEPHYSLVMFDLLQKPFKHFYLTQIVLWLRGSDYGGGISMSEGFCSRVSPQSFSHFS